MNNIGKNNQRNREAWLEKTLKKIPANLTILDAGAGELRYKKFCSHLKYVSQDFAQYDGRGDGVGPHTGTWDQTKLDIVSDIVSIPRPDHSFDAIMCIEVLEHVPNPVKAIEEFSRLIKKGGFLIITSPFCSMTHMAPFHFATGFNKYFYTEHLEKNGFEIRDIVQNGDYYEYLAQEMRRLPWVVHTYSNYTTNQQLSFTQKIIFKAFSFAYRTFILPLTLTLLQLYKKIDTGSSTFGGFGYHVYAQKM